MGYLTVHTLVPKKYEVALTSRNEERKVREN